MEDITSLKAEIDVKLCRETENLDSLRETLQQSQTTSKQMVSILESFDSRLKRLEETITPVYKETGSLQLQQSNYEKLLIALDEAIGYYHITARVQDTIKEGPESNPQGYMDAMEKLQIALKFFEQNNPDSPEMFSVQTLISSGRGALQEQFCSLLKRHSQPVSPVRILDSIQADGDSEDTLFQLRQVPESAVQDLRQIAEWLTRNEAGAEVLRDCAAVRSEVLLKTLERLRAHMRSASGGSGMSATASPAVNAKRGAKTSETPKKLNAKMLQKVKTARSLLMEGTRRSSLPSAALDSKEDGTEVEFESYLTTLLALLRLLQSEQSLLSEMIPGLQQKEAFDRIVLKAVEYVQSEGENIASQCRKAAARGDFPPVLALFPVLRQLYALRKPLIQVLEASPGSKAKVGNLIVTTSGTGAAVLDQFKEHVKNDPASSSSMPPDGTVHQLTSNTVVFLVQLQDFAETAGLMLISKDSSGTRAPSAETCVTQFADYLTKALHALGYNLLLKADTYTDTALRSVFLLNNCNYIRNSLEQSGLFDLIHKRNENARAYYEEQMIEYKAAYSESWSKVMHYITETYKPLSVPSDAAKLKDKYRQNIKDKFAGFNRELEELARVQRQYSVPARDLREQLRAETREDVLEKYTAFYQQFSQLQFTKNPEKYLRYKPEQVSQVINSLFEATE